MIVEVPEEVDFHAVSAALLVQGITGYGVLHDAARLQKGESVLVQAAAGGAGSLAVQFARLAGAGTIVGTTGSDEKRELVLGALVPPGLPEYRSPATSETATSGSSDHSSRSQKRLRPTGWSREARR
jgi:NADPH:quinone reductase-like Zn-dependent oxidoreductase